METEITIAQRAEILTEALPYIQKYAGRIVVIKYGGGAMVNPKLKEDVMGDIALLSQIGVKTVLVHGGGPEISELMQRVGKTSVFVDGLRVTDRETAEIAQMVLSGKVNKELVNLLQLKGGAAMGISGVDGNLITAKVKDEKLGFVGEITAVNPKVLLDLLEKGYIPVVSTVGRDAEGNIYNINADTAAAKIAVALKAKSMINLTDVAGLYADRNDAATLIKTVTLKDAGGLFEKGVISGGMIPKAECCIDAVKHGVCRVFIIDGREPHAILVEMLTDEGTGTMFTS